MADAASLFKKKKKGKAKKPMKFNANVENELTAKKAEEPSAREETTSAVDATWGGNEREIRVATGGRETEELVDMFELMKRDEHKLLEERVAKERAQEQFKATREAQQGRGTGEDPMAVAQPPPGAAPGLGGLQTYKPGGWREREAKRKAEEVTRMLNDTQKFPDLATAAKMPSDASTETQSRFGSRTGRFGAAGPGLSGYRIGRASAAPAPAEAEAPTAPVTSRAAGVWAKPANGGEEEGDGKAPETVGPAGTQQTAASADSASGGPTAAGAAAGGVEEAANGGAAPAAEPEAAPEPVDVLDKASLAAKFGAKKKKKPKKDAA